MRPAGSTTMPEPIRSVPRMAAEGCVFGISAWRCTVDGRTFPSRGTAAFTGTHANRWPGETQERPPSGQPVSEIPGARAVLARCAPPMPPDPVGPRDRSRGRPPTSAAAAHADARLEPLAIVPVERRPVEGRAPAHLGPRPPHLVAEGDVVEEE